MTKARSWLFAGVAGAAAWLALCLPALAHPHMWVTMEATLLYADGAFVGISQTWTFDEYYTAMAVEGLDKNKDGKFDRSELAELAKVNVDALKEFDYFTYPALAGQPVKLAEPNDYWLEHKDGLLALHFTLPFATPVLADAPGFTFSVQDPSFYIAFDLAKTAEPVRLGAGAPKTCRVKIEAPDERDASALAGPMSGLGGAMSIGSTVAVECARP